MKIKSIMDTNFQDYKQCSMLISVCYCNNHCENCQNEALKSAAIIDMPNKTIVARYLANPVASAIIFGGLEPFEQFDEVLVLISDFRKSTSDTIIIYTGFSEDKLEEKIKMLQKYPNIIVKFGAYKPNEQKVFDSILGIELASNNQYAKYISKEQ